MPYETLILERGDGYAVITLNRPPANTISPQVIRELEAVLDEVRTAGVQEVVVGGDVLPGPMPREVIERLAALDVPVRYIQGNGEREALGLLAGRPSMVPEAFRASVRWSAEVLSEAQREAVAGWPATRVLDVAGIGRVLFCHATPRNDTEIFTRLTADEKLLPIFGHLDAALVVCGHTHVQYDRLVSDSQSGTGRPGVARRIVNAGSVGMPYEGTPDARWAILHENGVTLVSTPYDAEAAFDALSETGYPLLEEWFGPVVRGEVTAEEATASFESRRGA